MIMRVAALCLVTMTALTGCMPGRAGDGEGTTAKPPAGGWPQPEDGKLTGKLCGLLTEADYKSLGHDSIDPLKPIQGKDSSNYVSCAGSLGEWLRLDLQPTAESAKLRYDDSLASRRDTVAVEKQQSILAEDLLPGADQSWFDYGPAPTGTKPGNYRVQFRRGALVASVELDPLNDASVKDPKAAVLRLAGLVLERIPEVGKADTGTTPKVRFEVKGVGKAVALSYSTELGSETLKDVDLPWGIEVPMADHGDNEVWLRLSADSIRTGMPVSVSCSISVRGAVVTQDQRLGFALCDARSPVR